MPVENKRNYEREDIDTDKLDYWYGGLMQPTGFFRMVVIALCIIGMIYAGHKLVGML